MAGRSAAQLAPAELSGKAGNYWVRSQWVPVSQTFSAALTAFRPNQAM